MYNKLQPPLKNYTLTGTIPETQCFMTLEHKEAILVLNKWIDGSILIDISGTFSVHILDYSYLTMQEILDRSFGSKIPTIFVGQNGYILNV